MDIRITTGLSPALPTPRQAATSRLQQWRAGATANGAGESPVPSSPPPEPMSAQPEFPYVRTLSGGYQESDPALALQRSRREAREASTEAQPFREPRTLPEDAAAKAISRAMQEALERDDQKDAQRAADRKREAIEREIAAEARRVLIEQQQAQLRDRVQRLGSILEIVVGRYAAAPAADASGRLDTRQ